MQRTRRYRVILWQHTHTLASKPTRSLLSTSGCFLNYQYVHSLSLFLLLVQLGTRAGDFSAEKKILRKFWILWSPWLTVNWEKYIRRKHCLGCLAHLNLFNHSKLFLREKKQKLIGNRLETRKHTEMSNSKTPVENVLEAYKTAIVAAKIVANAQQLTQAVAQVCGDLWEIFPEIGKVRIEHTVTKVTASYSATVGLFSMPNFSHFLRNWTN